MQTETIEVKQKRSLFKEKKENLVELWHTSVSTVFLLSCHFSNYTIAL